MIKVDQLSFSFSKDTPVINNVCFEAKAGSVLGIVGHNGSGKSTLLKLIAGLIKTTEGRIEIDGKILSHWSRKKLYGDLGFLIEKPAFYNHLSVEDNLKILCRYRSVDSKEHLAKMDFGGVHDYRNKSIRKLSTGMLQRVGLLAAVMFDPKIILLDEPTNGIDPDGVIEVRETIMKLKESGKTVIVASHVLTEIEKVSDQLLVLKRGRSLYHGDIGEVRKFRDLEEMYVKIQERTNVDF